MKKNIIIIILAIIAVAASVYWYLNYAKAPAVTPDTSLMTAEQIETSLKEDDTTGNINDAIDNIDLGDLDKEFQSIDSELQNL